MALSLICACGARFEVEDTLAGQDVACPECQQTLKAPALHGPSRRTSDLALASDVLALIGAFTVIGTIAAVVLGTLGLIRIRRNSDRVAGAGFAIFGIAAGTLFTTLTLLALSSGELFGLGAKFRRNMLGDRVDTSGELTHEDAAAGFRITRPSREWGVSDVDRLEDPIVRLMQGEQLGRKLDVLFVQTQRPVYVDVRSEPRLVGNIDGILDETVRELSSAGPQADPINPRRRPADDGNPIRITNVVPGASSKRLEAGGNVEALEKEVTVYCAGQQWKMLVRVYHTDGNKMFVVRAYGQRRHFEHGEADVRKLLDSFTILDGQ